MRELYRPDVYWFGRVGQAFSLSSLDRLKACPTRYKRRQLVRGGHTRAIRIVYPRFSTDSASPNVSTTSGIVCTGIRVTR